MNILPLKRFCCFKDCNLTAFVNRKAKTGIYYPMCEDHYRIMEMIGD